MNLPILYLKSNQGNQYSIGIQKNVTHTQTHKHTPTSKNITITKMICTKHEKLFGNSDTTENWEQR